MSYTPATAWINNFGTDQEDAMGLLGTDDVIWEKLGCNTATLLNLYRAKVPGGWFVVVVGGESESPTLTFYPDPNHEWDGKSLD